jgi:putative membrane protein
VLPLVPARGFFLNFSIVKEYILLYLKGIAMGAADVVPGVSGGTVAFISGIYEKLLTSIRNFNGKALGYLVKFKLKDLWQYVNGTFLLVLLAGIGTSILGLSKIVLHLLKTYPELIWAFFFGLVVASALVVGRKIGRWTPGTIGAGLVGTAMAYWVTVAVPVSTPTDLWFIFLSGAIAICAMILPGISGSFILLLMGKYQYIFERLHAVTDGLKNGFTLDWDNLKIILTFILGCVTGLLSFSHVLNWMLKRYHDLAVALLMGFMVGSLNKVWPWKKVLQYYTNSKGEKNPLQEANVLPTDYLAEVGKDPQLWLCIVLALVGFLLVYGLEKLSDRADSRQV